MEAANKTQLKKILRRIINDPELIYKAAQQGAEDQMKIIQLLQKKKKKLRLHTGIIKRHFDAYTAYPLTDKEISKNKVLMKYYKSGYDDGKVGNERQLIKSDMFQQSYDRGFNEGNRDF